MFLVMTGVHATTTDNCGYIHTDEVVIHLRAYTIREAMAFIADHKTIDANKFSVITVNEP